MISKIINKIMLLIDLRSTKTLKIGRHVEFINSGKIMSINSYLGYNENKSVKIANKSKEVT